jgi:uncharacterized protein
VKDLVEGMTLNGIVTNVAAFGAFVDIGVHQDGLVHVSQLADRFVKDPNQIVKVGQQVQVKVMSVDLQRKRIGLSMRKDPVEKSSQNAAGKSAEQKARPKRAQGQKPQPQKQVEAPMNNLAAAFAKSGFKVKKNKNS